MIDLHVHTNASDGEYSVEEIIKIAKEKNINTMAITDHDSCMNVEEVMYYGSKNGINVISGVEITTFENEEIHILGYNIDYSSKLITEYEKYNEQLEIEENDYIFKFFSNKGIKITKQAIEKYMGNEKFSAKFVGEWLVDNGYAKTRAEAYSKYFIDGELKNRKRNRMLPKQAIEFINKLGGIAVWAHPCRFDIDNNETIIKDIERYKSYGLKGIEAVYSMHSDEQIEELMKSAKKYDLIYTLGSDYHGPSVKKCVEIASGIKNNLIKYQTCDNEREIIKNILR